MSGHTKWSKLREELEAKPGAKEAIARAREESLEEIRLYDLRHAEAVSQAELAGRLEVTQGAISKFEHAEDVRLSTLRQYLHALGARLELVAVFDDEERRVPVHHGPPGADTPGSPRQGESSTGSSTGSSPTSRTRATPGSGSPSRKRSSDARTSTQRNRRSPGSADS